MSWIASGRFLYWSQLVLVARVQFPSPQPRSWFEKIGVCLGRGRRVSLRVLFQGGPSRPLGLFRRPPSFSRRFLAVLSVLPSFGGVVRVYDEISHRSLTVVGWQPRRPRLQGCSEALACELGV